MIFYNDKVFYDSEFAEDELDYLKNYTVLSTSSSHGYTTGFYGCFLENNITHEIVYAIRGTEGIMSEDIDDDLDIVNSGMAYKQFIDAYNYYMKLHRLTPVVSF